MQNLGSAMSVPTDPPYCLMYSTSYMRGVDPNHFDTCNNPARMRMRHCICRATLQFMNPDPDLWRLILPCGTKYNKQIFPMILKLHNHCKPLTDRRQTLSNGNGRGLSGI